MERLKQPEVFLGFLIATALFAVALIIVSLMAAYGSAPTTTFGGWLVRDAAGFFALFALVVAAAQAVMFYFQLYYMRRTIQETERTYQLQARTWVFAGPQASKRFRVTFLRFRTQAMAASAFSSLVRMTSPSRCSLSTTGRCPPSLPSCRWV